MKVLRVLAVGLLALVLFGAGVAGTGYAVQRYADSDEQAAPAPGDSGDAAPQPSASPSTPPAEPEPTPTPSPSARPSPTQQPPVLSPGASGERVRELQHRLFQLAWWPEQTTGSYDGTTEEAVAGFQRKRGLRDTGVVDRRTWARLVRMTRAPTHDEKFNILRPGPTLIGRGEEGDDVRDLQARLKQIAWFSGDVTGTYGDVTAESVRGFQEKREIPVTGQVDQRTMDRLVAMTYEPTYEEKHNIEPEPGALDPRCETGRVLCIDKSGNSLRWVVDGQVQSTFDVRFGASETPTREGEFTVYLKSRDHVSSLYDSEMPFAMFFSGGQAVHYSSDFATYGYGGASHGCVNVRDYDGIAALYDQVQIGDRVVVYWS